MLRELSYIFKNPRIVIILLVVPFLLTTICGFVYSEGALKNLRLGIIDKSQCAASRELIEAFHKSDVFAITNYYDSEEDIAGAFSRDEIDGVLIIPKDYGRLLLRGEQANVLLGANGANMAISSTVQTRGAEIIATASAETAVKMLVAKGETIEQATNDVLPVAQAIRPWYNPTINFSHFLLLVYSIGFFQQALIYFTALAINREKSEDGSRSHAVIQAGNTATVAGKLAAYTVTGLISWAAVFGACVFLFHLPMQGSWLVLSVLSVAFTAALSACGFLFSTFLSKPVIAVSLGLIITYPSLLFSGFTWPQIAMPPFFKVLAHVFPYTYFALPVRNIALAGAGLMEIKTDLLVLASICIVAFILTNLILHQQIKKSIKITNSTTAKERTEENEQEAYSRSTNGLADCPR